MKLDIKSFFAKKVERPYLIATLIRPPMQKAAQLSDRDEFFMVSSDFYSIAAWAYESCALLGRAKKDDLATFLKLDIAKPGEEDNVINYLQEQAKKRMEKFRKLGGNAEKEPVSFYALFVLTNLKDSNVKISEAPKDVKKLQRTFSQQQAPLSFVSQDIVKAGFEGIGFGSLYPELTESMFRNIHENGQDCWPEGRKFEIALPEPDREKLEAREKALFTTVAKYADEYHPELVERLNLSDYIRKK